MNNPISDDGLDTLFRSARTQNAWTDQSVSDITIQALYDILKWAPTSANCSPARFVFLKSEAAKVRLKPFLLEQNVEKTMSAPVTVIIGQDLDFPDHLPKLFPHADAKSWFQGNNPLIEETAFRNASLQGGYLILAARALGLDCGPMSGFDQAGVDGEFFAATNIKSNFLCNLGHGDPSGLFSRSPRLSFDEACDVL